MPPVYLKAGPRGKGLPDVPFRVNPDSFPTYLAARQMADKVNLPEGREISGSGQHRMRAGEVEVKRLKEPEPKKPDPNAKPRPPKLGTKLD